MSAWIATLETLLANGWHKSTCPWCGNPVVTNGASVCDPDPSDAGTVVIEARRGEPTVVVREDVVGRIPLWRAHLYTCEARPSSADLARR